ncbi:MAG: dTDP-4-dehydrorhamnose 3,5-epimerase [Bacteroidota bacterium]|jgi:dTDP-4-dehydrorhamnose 3,5-epimerase
MTIEATTLPGVLQLQHHKHQDARGSFVKLFHESTLQNAGINFTVRESFYSTSHKGVLRGMHFHQSPHEHAKIVLCTSGSILDVVLDIRQHSPTFGQTAQCILSAEKANALYIPEGFAHGFVSLEDNSTTLYLQNGMYSAEHDSGILYNSFNFAWPDMALTISDRDNSFQSLEQYKQQ